MKCEVCNETELDGCENDEELEIGVKIINALLALAPRNWIQCEACNRLVCYRCCQSVRSGYCDYCIDKDKLYALNGLS